MRVVGVVGGSDAAAFDAVLRHGSSPDLVAYDHGYVMQQPLDARRDETGDLVLRVRVAPLGIGEPRPVAARRGQDAGLVVPPGIEPDVRQRFAAYAVVPSDRGVLATEYSDRTAVPGRWGMPGGGIDRSEQPVDAVLREVAEETSQAIVLGALVRVQISHWLGRSPGGRIEDFHAVRLIYQAACPQPTEPLVVDVGGTTQAARWVPLDGWRSVTWTRNWQQILGELLPPDGAAPARSGKIGPA